MTPKPRIAFCTTNKGRTKHLRLTLPRNLADNVDYDNCVFVVVDYNSPDDMVEYLTSSHALDIASGRVVVYSHREPGPFRMAHAKNLSHRLGILEGGEILVNLDADGYSGPGFASYIAEKFVDNKSRDVFMQAMWNRWVPRPGGEPEWLAQEPSGELGPPVPKGSNGRMVVASSAFLLAGGYNEKDSTWSPDDKDFNVRMRRLGHEPLLLERRFQETILHNNRTRFREYPHAEVLMHSYEFHMKVEDSDEAIANFGKVGCGTVYRNFDFSRPMTLGPIPTRIFGIGMHKTATTSLSRAMSILGYPSAHWKSAHWAKAIWREMNTSGHSPTLERHYALCDLPIAPLFRKLDAAYPGSKFILTVRREAEWLDSVRRHWSGSNPFRSAWDSDPFTHIIHRHLYGTTEFDPEVFVERYRRHNAEVMAHFDSRPDDLMVMAVGDGWKELCRFLGRPMPAVPYPLANVGG